MGIVIALVMLMVAIPAFARPSHADDPHIHGVTVPDWYDSNCCGNNDCKPVEDKDIEFGLDEQGLPIAIYKPTHNTFPLKDLNGNRSYQHRDSKDERYHVCINPMTKASLCFYSRAGI